MPSNAQTDLNAAIEDARSSVNRVIRAGREVQNELTTLREMHSQLSALNAERQRVIASLADMAQNLYSIALPFMSQGDSVWRAMQEEYVATMKLTGREPKL